MSRWAGRLLLAFYVAFTALPMLAGLAFALAYSLGFFSLLGGGFTWRHWQAVLSDGATWASLAYSAALASLTLGLSLALGLFVLGRWPGLFRQPLWRQALQVPLAIPPMVMAFFLFQWLGRAGFLSRAAYALGLSGGIDSFPVLVNDAWGLGILLGLLGLIAPFFLLLLAGIYHGEQLDELRSVALGLGATARQARWRVLYPVLLYRSRAALAAYWVFALSSFELPLLLGQQRVQMFSVLVWRHFRGFDLSQQPRAFVLCVLYAALLLLLLRWGAFSFRPSSSSGL